MSNYILLGDYLGSNKLDYWYTSNLFYLIANIIFSFTRSLQLSNIECRKHSPAVILKYGLKFKKLSKNVANVFADEPKVWVITLHYYFRNGPSSLFPYAY